MVPNTYDELIIESGYMLPSLASGDRPNRPGMHSIPFGELRGGILLCGVKMADFPHIIFRHLGAGMCAPAKVARAALGISISHVVFVRAYKEMRRIAARRVVASVADMHVVGDIYTGELQRKPMRPLASMPALCLDRQSSVAIDAITADPWPTGIRATATVNLRPESIRDSRRRCGTLTRTRAGLSAMLRRGIKRRAALLTDCIYGTILVHRGVTPNQSFRGAVPRAVDAAPRLLHASIIPNPPDSMGFCGTARGIA